MSSRRKNGMVAQMKQLVNTLTLRMQFFHLDPQWKNFLEICDCTKLKSEQDHVYEYWRLGCLTTYADYWIEQYGDELPLLTDDAQADYLEKFTELEDKLIKKLTENPTSTALDQVWYLYFATGEYKYLKAAFEIAGHDKAKRNLRDDAIMMYATIDDQYFDKITEALDHDSNYFTNHDCYTVRSAKYNWDRLKAEIEGKNDEMEEQGIVDGTTDAEIDDILAKVKGHKFVPDSSDNIATAHEKKLEHGVDVFNRVLIRLKENDEL
jgi:hypothetical protein